MVWQKHPERVYDSTLKTTRSQSKDVVYPRRTDCGRKSALEAGTASFDCIRTACGLRSGCSVKRKLDFGLVCVVLLLVLAACTPPAQPAATPPPATATAAPSPIVAATVAATAVPTATAAATSVPTVAPAQPPSEVEDPTVYTAALRPEVASEVDLAGLTRYRLYVVVSSELTEFEGRAYVHYTNPETAPLDEVYFHLYPNLWAPVMQLTQAGVNGEMVEADWRQGEFVARIPLADPLEPGASVDMVLDFEVTVPEEGVGNYDELAFKEGVLALTHFYPTVAVFDAGNGGWQIERPAPQGDVIYHDASLYDVRLETDAGVQVAATGVELERRQTDDSVIWRFGGGPMRDFTATLSREYDTATATVDGVTYSSYYLPGSEVNAEAALDIAAAAVATFEAEFGPYPYRELDIAATGTTAAGIEYPGLIVLAAGLYEREPGNAGFEAVIVHETAHQWWYAVVGNDQLHDPWLDEALAQYSTYLYFQDRYGEQGAAGFLAALDDRWARVDRIEKPIGLPVSAYPEGEYSGVVYGRGPLFLVALAERLGPERMAEFLQRYYAEQTWDIATPAEFEALAETIAGAPLDDLFAAWVYPLE